MPGLQIKELAMVSVFDEPACQLIVLYYPAWVEVIGEVLAQCGQYFSQVLAWDACFLLPATTAAPLAAVLDLLVVDDGWLTSFVHL